MKAPLSWLQDFVAVDLSADEVAAVLNDLGLVIEGVERVGAGLDGVFVARVSRIESIPGADKIRRVEVDAGGVGEVQVVCGAWNFSEGDLVPLATVGARLPNGVTIAERKMKGVVSRGMICSGRELALSDDGEGILVLDLDAPLGTPLADALGVVEDVVFDIAVEGNRPDALCVAGVARDLAGRLGLPFSIPSVGSLVGTVDPAGVRAAPGAAGATAQRPASVDVECPELCDRFGAWVIEGVRVGPSPSWMQRRLSLAGMRPINNVVDVSNYVMLEIGQPNHPYDLDRLGGGGLIVREAKPGERLVTLDGVERVLGLGFDGAPGAKDCVIADATSAVVGIAGIMGGSSSEISETTSTILLEVAHFAAMDVSRTSKRLGLRTEASVRFERGCDPGAIEAAGERFVELLAAISPADSAHPASRRLDAALGPLPVERSIVLRIDRVNGILGTTMTSADAGAHLSAIGFRVTDRADGNLGVSVPTFRPDCEREIDLIEEVARLAGYASIPRRIPASPRSGGLTSYQRERRRVKGIAAYAIGAAEAWTPTFVPPGDHARVGLHEPCLRVANPVAVEESILRATILPGLLSAAARNVSHRNTEIRLFEVGHVFAAPVRDTPSVPDEREVLALLVAADSASTPDGGSAAMVAWRLLEGALRLDGVVVDQSQPVPGLHPGRSARLVSGGTPVGTLGEVAPEVVAAFGCGPGRYGFLEVALGWESLAGRFGERGAGILTTVPRRSSETWEPSHFPSADVDLAFVVPEDVPAAEVLSTLRHAAGGDAETVELFDVYRGPELTPGTRSLAFRLRLVSGTRTLTDADIHTVRDRCIDGVASAHRAPLRS